MPFIPPAELGGFWHIFINMPLDLNWFHPFFPLLFIHSFSRTYFWVPRRSGMTSPPADLQTEFRVLFHAQDRLWQDRKHTHTPDIHIYLSYFLLSKKCLWDEIDNLCFNESG
jgi:hypothetical protein